MTRTERVVHFTVKIPKGCDSDDVAQFGIDALSSWGGQFHPEDPLFDSLTVTAIWTSTKRYKLDATGSDLAPPPTKPPFK